MSQPRCPYCLDDIRGEDEPVRCARCGTPHHAACFQEHQACVAFGCASSEEVPAGTSLFRRPLITLPDAPTREAALGPFVVGWKRLPPIPEQRPAWRCPPEYARMSLEGREVREGQVLRGRGVVYTPRALSWKRIDLCLLQGIARPEPVARITLAEPPPDADDELGVGTHPFYLEVQAPPTTGPVDPFTFELVLVRGFLRGEVRSLPLHLFLLEQRHAPARLERAAGPRPSPGLTPRERESPAPDVVAKAGAADLPDDEGGWTELPVVSPTGIFSHDPPTGRTFAARFTAPPLDEGPLTLHAPALLGGADLPLRLTSSTAVASLSLAVHYELVRPGGVEVSAPGLPATDEARVLGHGALEAARFGRRAGVEVVVRLPQARLDALARARAEGAHNATLRLRLGVDAIEAGGRVVTVPSRTVTYTGPVPDPPRPV